MPREIFDGLTEHGRQLCQYLVADSQETLVTGYDPELGKTPPAFRKEYDDIRF